MKATIRRILHTAQTKRELFALIGEFCASVDVRQALGGPINSDESHVWFIAVDEVDDVIGFAAVVPQKNRKAKMVHLYMVTEAKGTTAICKRLVDACEKEAKAMDAKEIHTVDYTNKMLWYADRNWAIGTQRGQFTTYTKSLES